MRCRMRCGDIWRCGGPIKKYVPVDSIGIEGRTQEMTFDSQVPPYSVTYSISISPSDATKKDVRIESNNPSIISVDSVESGQVTFTIHSEGEARIRITSLADADISDEYGVTITAPSQQFSPNNGIFVDVDTEGTATGRKRKTKATATGDRFTARVFMLNEDNPNYVLLEWVHGGDVSKTYVGAANEAHTRAMFTEETTDKLAREIETLWDDGQIANGFVKFTDETWGVIEQFYSEPLTPEAVEALQEVLVNNEIVTPESYTITIETEAKPENTVINYCINETWTYEAPESDFPMAFDFSEPISLSYQSDVIYCGALLDNGSYQFWGTYEDNSVYIEMNGEPLSNGDEITIDSDTTLKFIWDPPAPERCPASLVSVWGDDSTISIGETTAVVTNFTTSADCANVDYSNIVATPSSNIVTTNVDINGRKVYVTGVSAGQCTITFSDGDNSWTFNVTVQAPVVQSIEDFSDAYVLCGETMNVYVDILPLDASYSTGDFNLIFTDGSGNVVQNPPVTADVVSILNVEGHVAGIGIEVIGGQTTGDVYMTVEYTPSQGAISGGGWIHVGPAATALSDISPLQIRVGELGSYRVGGLTPSDALTKGITVTSSDDSVVSVGLLYNDLGSLLVDLEGLSAGEATLTITLTNGAEYEKTVTVVDRWQTVVETMHGGIYHNAEDGIYYLTDATGTNQLVIADKNLNATGLWDPNDWDDSGTYGTWGGKYQWGNNYDFNLEHTTSHEQVDASAYGPSNPYNVDVLITPENQGNYYFWDSSSNTNLWGYDDYDTSYQSGTPDVSVMKGPCPEGWHVPLREEWNQLLQLWSYIRTGSTTAPADTTLMSSDLLLPTYDDGWGLLRANFLNVGETTKPVGFVRGVPAAGLYPFEEDTYNIRPFINELPEDLPEWNASGNTCYAELQYVADEISLETPYQVSSTIQYDGCENVDPTNITTSSDDENVAVAEVSFDTNGATLIIRSVAPGTCTVTTTDGNNSFTTAVTITAPTPPTYATISSGSENVTMAPGDTVTKRISFSPSNADTSNITWTNSDSNVANGSQQLLLEGMCDTVINANSEGTCTITVSDGTNSYVYNVTVVGAEPESHTFTINVENLPEGADISGEIIDPETSETLEEISVSSFPMAIELPLSDDTISLGLHSNEGDGDISFQIPGERNYQININCDGYKPLFESVGFSLDDTGDGSYTGVIEAINLDSDVSLTISFTPIEEPESHTFTINAENVPEGVNIDNGEGPLDFPIILDIPSGGSFNGFCDSHEEYGMLNVTIYDTPDGSSEGVVSEVNIECGGYKPLFETVGFDLEDAGDGAYNFIKDDNYQIVPDSDASLTISFTPVE